MRLTHHPLAFTAAALLLAACADKPGLAKSDSAGTPVASASGASSAGATSGDQELADVQSYQLTMDKVDKFLAAQRNLALRMKAMPPAEREAMKARAEAAGANGDDSMDEMVRKIEAEPALAGAVKDAGLSAREYAVITMSLLQSSMAAGVLRTRPKDNQDSLVREMKANPANVRFIQQNEAELQRKQQALAEEMKRMGVPTDG